MTVFNFALFHETIQRRAFTSYLKLKSLKVLKKGLGDWSWQSRLYLGFLANAKFLA